MVRGSRLALVQSRETIIADCQRFRPTWINGVPYFFQRVHHKLVEKGRADQPGILRQTLGGDIRACCCGGGALDDTTYEFFARHDIPLLQGYGLTETSPVISFNLPGADKRGTVGRADPRRRGADRIGWGGLDARSSRDAPLLAR